MLSSPEDSPEPLLLTDDYGTTLWDCWAGSAFSTSAIFANPSYTYTDLTEKGQGTIEPTLTAFTVVTQAPGSPGELTTVVKINEVHPNRHGVGNLSTGSKAGIAVSVGVSAIAALSVLAFFLLRRKSQGPQRPSLIRLPWSGLRTTSPSAYRFDKPDDIGIIGTQSAAREDLKRELKEEGERLGGGGDDDDQNMKVGKLGGEETRPHLELGSEGVKKPVSELPALCGKSVVGELSNQQGKRYSTREIRMSELAG